MLKGTITVKAKEGFSDKTYVYTVVGKDTPTNFTGIISSYAVDSLLFLGDGAMDNMPPKREFVITQGTYKVQQVLREVNVKGVMKKKKAPINKDVFGRLGALMSYCKQRCNNSTSTEDNLIADASGIGNSSVTSTFSIPKGITDEIIGTVTRQVGTVIKMDIETDYFIIHLEEDGNNSSQVFNGIGNSQTYAFRFDKDTLGFPIRKPVIAEEMFGLYNSLEEIIEAHPEKDFLWLRGKQYKVVRPEEMEQVLEQFYNADENTDIAFDTETTGLEINFKSRTGEADVCVGIILSMEDGVSYFFPMQMKNIENMCGGDHVYFMTKYIKPILENKKIAVFNGAFDWKVAYIYDIDTNITDDIYIMNQLTFKAEKPNFAASLKKLTAVLLNRDSIELDDINKSGVWGADGLTFDMLTSEVTALYACPDTDNVFGLLQYFRDNRILESRNATQAYKIELKFSMVLAYQEFWGHCVDKANSDKLRQEVYYELAREKQLMVEIAGRDFNPNSSQVLMHIMYDELGIPEQFDKGKRTTNKAALTALLEYRDENDEPLYPFVQHLSNYKAEESNRKLLIKFEGSSDGFMFSSVEQFKSTGRVSVSDPNYQSYNDTVKKYIIPRPSFYMVDTDYSSVESRVMSCMAGNKPLITRFFDPDFDFHRYQAARMFNVPYENVTPEMRSQAKGVDFGLPYGMGDAQLGFRIFGKYSPETKAKAKYLREKFFEGQEDILHFFEFNRDKACQTGYSETYFKRRRHYDRTVKSIDKIRREAGNAVIQGTAADIYKLAMVRVFDRIRREGWLGKVLIPAFVHDEGLFEVSDTINPAVFLKALREEFEVKIEGWCPLYMGFGYGSNWKEAKKTEIPIQLQWEWVEKYGETGYPFWDGNIQNLMKWVHSELDRFQIEHIKEDITAESSQGEPIKPHINGLLVDVFYADNNAYHSIIKKKVNLDDSQLLSNPKITSKFTPEVQSEIMKNLRENRYLLDDADPFNFPVGADGNIIYDITEKYTYIPKSSYINIVKGVLKYSDDIIYTDELQSLLIQQEQEIIEDYKKARGVTLKELPRNENNQILVEVCKKYGLKPKDKNYDVQKLLNIYCDLHNIDRNTVNILTPEVEDSEKADTKDSVKFLNLAIDEEETEENRNRIINSRLNIMGVSIDNDTNIVYLSMIPNQYLGLVRNLTVDPAESAYRVVFRDMNNKQDYLTERYVLPKDITALQTLYTEILKVTRA